MSALAPVWTRSSILDFLHQHAADLRAFGIAKIGLFGSYGRGEQTAESDIDLVFTAAHTLDWENWMDAWNFLEDRLHSPIDLIPESNLREEIRANILNEVQYVEVG